MSKKKTKMTQEEWGAEMRARFGEDPMDWAFICPVCGHVQKVSDFRDAKAPHDAVGFSCIGRWTKGSKDAWSEGDNAKGCNYAGGGLIQVNPLLVVSSDGEQQVFDFAPCACGNPGGTGHKIQCPNRPEAGQVSVPAKGKVPPC